MRKRRMALAMALVMTLQSVPAYSMTGYAADFGTDEIVDEIIADDADAAGEFLGGEDDFSGDFSIDGIEVEELPGEDTLPESPADVPAPEEVPDAALPETENTSELPDEDLISDGIEIGDSTVEVQTETETAEIETDAPEISEPETTVLETEEVEKAESETTKTTMPETNEVETEITTEEMESETELYVQIPADSMLDLTADSSVKNAQEQYPVLVPGTEYSLNSGYTYFDFTPEHTGFYVISAENPEPGEEDIFPPISKVQVNQGDKEIADHYCYYYNWDGYNKYFITSYWLEKGVSYRYGIMGSGKMYFEENPIIPLKLNTDYNFTGREEVEEFWYSFTPSKTAIYEFSSLKGWVSIRLYDADSNFLKGTYGDYDDDGDTLSATLNAGKTYYYRVEFDSPMAEWTQIRNGTLRLTQKEVPQEPGCQHKYTTIVDKAATCGMVGSQHEECSICHDKKAATTIPATGQHKYTTIVDKAATCGATGSQHEECSVCHTKKAATTIPATGNHTYGDYEETKAPTALEEGEQTRTCKVCGKTDTAPIAKLKPTYTLSSKTLVLKEKQKTTKLTVTDLAKGDSVKSWKSSNTKVVKVSGKKNGTSTVTAQKLASGKKSAKATITITLASGKALKVTVTVQKTTVKTSKIAFAEKKLKLDCGSTLKLEPIVTPITSAEKVTYKSSNEKIVSVNAKGEVKALSAGTVKITAQSGKKSAVVSITVPKVKTKKITGLKKSLSLKKGKTIVLKPKLNPVNSTEKITYKSANTKIATVNAAGKITAKKKGKVKITVTSGKAKFTCTLTVK